MRILLRCLLTIFIFLVTLELLSYIALKTRFLKHPSVKATHTTPEKYKNFVENFRNLHPEINVLPAYNLDLLLEPSLPVVGEKSRRPLLGPGGLSKNVDDIFVLKGRISGREKFRVRYTTDDFGRRKTSYLPEKFSQNIVLLGDSFTWGEGVEQEKIFSAVLAKELTGAHISNLGIPGTSPASILKLMKQGGFYSSLDKEKPSTFVFTFIDDHLRRIVGTSDYLLKPGFAENAPEFYLEQGELKFSNSFSDSPWRTALLKLFALTNFSRATRIELPVISESDLELTAKIFTELKKETSKHFPNMKEFYVAIYPGENIHIPGLRIFLEKENIKLLDYSEINLQKLLNGHHTLIVDHHPSALAHEFYGKLLAQDLK